MSICFDPIGVVRVDYADEEVKKAFLGVEGVIEVFPEFQEGLEGIEEFSHIIAVFYLHKTTEDHRKVLKVRPRRYARYGYDVSKLPEVGVFCTDSPHRPNPIAITILELVERRGRMLKVRGLDVFNGTPVLDIKAYTPSRSVKVSRLPEWYKTVEKWSIEIKSRFTRDASNH